MDLGELIALNRLMDEEELVCPFEEFKLHDCELEEECRDKLAVNLKNGLLGTEGTYASNLPANLEWFPCEDETWSDKIRVSFKQRLDFDGSNDSKLDVSNVEFSKEEGDYVYKEDAHHLIPGKGSFKPSDLYQKLLKERIAIEVECADGTLRYTRKGKFGYNINGSHNGIWLPSSRGIEGWGMESKKELTHVRAGEKKPEWQAHYIVAAMSQRKRQFHGPHGSYNKKVTKDLENHIYLKVYNHLRAVAFGYIKCEECKKRESNTLPPPLIAIRALQKYSWILRKYIGQPDKWNKDYVASSHWAEVITAKSVTNFLSTNNQTATQP